MLFNFRQVRASTSSTSPYWVSETSRSDWLVTTVEEVIKDRLSSSLIIELLVFCCLERKPLFSGKYTISLGLHKKTWANGKKEVIEKEIPIITAINIFLIYTLAFIISCTNFFVEQVKHRWNIKNLTKEPLACRTPVGPYNWPLNPIQCPGLTVSFPIFTFVLIDLLSLVKW